LPLLLALIQRSAWKGYSPKFGPNHIARITLS
jgi:hypothetical protein